MCVSIYEPNNAQTRYKYKTTNLQINTNSSLHNNSQLRTKINSYELTNSLLAGFVFYWDKTMTTYEIRFIN